jgi:hypothetical protein
MILFITAALLLYFAFSYFFIDSIDKKKKINELENQIFIQKMNEYFLHRGMQWEKKFVAPPEGEVKRFKKQLKIKGYYNGDGSSVVNYEFKKALSDWASDHNEDFISGTYFGETSPENYARYLANFSLSCTYFADIEYYDYLYDKDSFVRTFSEEIWISSEWRRRRPKIYQVKEKFPQNNASN